MNFNLQALGIHAAHSDYIDEHGIYRSQFDFVMKGATALAGIFAFFMIEQLMQTYSHYSIEKKKNKRLKEVLAVFS